MLQYPQGLWDIHCCICSSSSTCASVWSQLKGCVLQCVLCEQKDVCQCLLVNGKIFSKQELLKQSGYRRCRHPFGGVSTNCFIPTPERFQSNTEKSTTIISQCFVRTFYSDWGHFVWMLGCNDALMAALVSAGCLGKTEPPIDQHHKLNLPAARLLSCRDEAVHVL